MENIKNITQECTKIVREKEEDTVKVLVTGVAGQLGYDVMNELAKRDYDRIGSDIASKYTGTINSITTTKMPYVSMDITDTEEVERVIADINPDTVIHCAAWTAVDSAENSDVAKKVYDVNVNGTCNVTAMCKKIGCKMVYISTDYVFDGQGSIPWQPDCKEFNPLNYYGKTKLQGENIVSSLLDRYFIVRTAWVFGINGNNFVKAMLRLGEKNDTIRVVNDQIGTPTYTEDLARLLVDMIGTEKYGYYHATNEGGYISWYEFACEIFRQTGCRTRVLPVTTKEYGLSVATRPFNSRMDKKKLLQTEFKPLPDWKDALNRYLYKLKLHTLTDN